MSAGKRAARSSDKQLYEIGPYFKRQNKVISIVVMIGLAVATAVGFVFYQIGKSDGVKEAEKKRISQGLSKGSQAVAENKTSESEGKFARMLKDAELAGTICIDLRAPIYSH